jgi:hypothetical protein
MSFGRQRAERRRRLDGQSRYRDDEKAQKRQAGDFAHRAVPRYIPGRERVNLVTG